MGAVLGALVGAISFLATGRILYLVVGILIGALLGQAAGWLSSRISTARLVTVDRRMNVTLGIMSVMMSVAGAVAYWNKGEGILLVGVAFFGLCALCLLASPF
jgi:hypothetical protein